MATSPADHGVAGEHAGVEALVGQGLEQPLAGAELHQVHEECPVGQHSVGDLDGPGALELAGQELAPDRVADVVGQEPDAVDPEVGERAAAMSAWSTNR